MKGKQPTPKDDKPMQWKSPFAALKDRAVSSAVTSSPTTSQPKSLDSKKSRGRIEILRSTAHRGGKTVTVVSGFLGISQAEKERLATAMQKACGAGGTVKDGRIEIQGDHRTAVARILSDAGFRPVFAGG